MSKYISIKIIIFFIINFFVSVNLANAGILDWFSKDSCKEYSDYTCKQLEN